MAPPQTQPHQIAKSWVPTGCQLAGVTCIAGRFREVKTEVISLHLARSSGDGNDQRLGGNGPPVISRHVISCLCFNQLAGYESFPRTETLSARKRSSGSLGLFCFCWLKLLGLSLPIDCQATNRKHRIILQTPLKNEYRFWQDFN